MKGNKKISKGVSNEVEINKKGINNSEDREFENYLQKIEDPDYDGQDVS